MPRYSKPYSNDALAILMTSFFNGSDSLGFQYIRIICSHLKSPSWATPSDFNDLMTSLWCTSSVMSCSYFCRCFFSTSVSTWSARRLSTPTHLSSTPVSALTTLAALPALRAFSTLSDQSTCTASNTICAGNVLTQSRNADTSIDLASPVATLAYWSTASSRRAPRVFCMACSTRESQALMAGSSEILTTDLKCTTSPSRELMPTIWSGSSVSSSRAVMPANILLRCRWTTLTSRELPIISSKSSSPTK
mmetsp:Transcript_24250/g.59859  ORF Transcript_24250/g.59859 Transcript_24250/m.59859 type:complete len:249 (+) Transcript_24250:8490-9236(+)